MPNITLTDIARMRVETMSFFLVVLLASALLIQLLWNFLRRDFVRLPRLTYFKSCALICMWGLLFLLVLTMISGARELMTPGAWEKAGFTYRLKSDTRAEDREVLDQVESQRLARLEGLKSALWAHARDHGGALPAEAYIKPQLLVTSDISGARFNYIAGATMDPASDRIVAYEPPIFAPPRYALRANGTITRMRDHELQQALATRVQQ